MAEVIAGTTNEGLERVAGSPIEFSESEQVTRIFHTNTTQVATYSEPYQSYSGADITAVVNMPGEDRPLVLGELQTLSYSIHRENKPTRILGRTAPIGFCKGPRTIAGSLIFTQFDRYAFYRFNTVKAQVSGGMYPLADMLPPFDIVLSFTNETGNFSKMKIYGITIVDEGGTMSIDDLLIEQTYTFMARAIQPMINYVPENMEQNRVAGRSRTTPSIRIR